MTRWLTEYIDKNRDDWEKGRKIREEARNSAIEEWEKRGRLEKIQLLKQKYEKRGEPVPNREEDKTKKEDRRQKESWARWRPDATLNSTNTPVDCQTNLLTCTVFQDTILSEKCPDKQADTTPGCPSTEKQENTTTVSESPG